MHALSSTWLSLCALLLVRRAIGTGIRFVTPAAGATWPAGPITVTWQDAGGDPSMSELSTYILQLVIGGNTVADSQAIQTIGSANALVGTGTVEDTIPPDIAQSVENGFYLMMTSNTTGGDQVINYSNRFTLIDMNGTTASVYLDGANSASGATDVPAAQYNIISSPTGGSGTTATSATSIATSGSSSSLTTSTATSTPTESPQGSSIAKGAIVGLAIGLLVALILIAGIVIWALFRWRSKRKQQRARKGEAQFLGSKAELPASESMVSSATLPVELSPTVERYEVHGFDKAVEASASRHSIYELDGNWDGWEAGSGRRSKAYDPTL